MSKNTTFKYRDRVRIKDGFFGGETGTVVSENVIDGDLVGYMVRLADVDDEYFVAAFRPAELEKV